MGKQVVKGVTRLRVLDSNVGEQVAHGHYGGYQIEGEKVSVMMIRRRDSVSDKSKRQLQ